MNKLTQEQVGFINRYLENSGIDYFDVRLEIVDHIATAIEEAEGDFYENFNAYMAQHKEELLALYKKQKIEMLKVGAKEFLMTAIQPHWLALLVLLALGVTGITNIAGVEIALNILEYMFVGMTAIVTVHFLYNFLWHKRKYFMTWTMLSCNYIGLVWILYFFNYDNILKALTLYAALAYYTLLWYLFIVFYITFFRIRKELVQRYKIV